MIGTQYQQTMQPGVERMKKLILTTALTCCMGAAAQADVVVMG